MIRKISFLTTTNRRSRRLNLAGFARRASAWGVFGLVLSNSASLPVFASDLTPSEKSGSASTAPSLTLRDQQLTDQWQDNILPLLQNHCSDCHSGDEPEASVDVLSVDSLDQMRTNPSLWDQIRGVVRIGAMPPPDYGQMEVEDREQLDRFFYEVLHVADCDLNSAPPPVTVRRLNAREYDNTIQDLFGIELEPSKIVGFVSDQVGNGFDNQGEVLTLSPLALEKYFAAAELISETVIISDRESLKKHALPNGSHRQGESVDVNLELAAGKYRLRLGGKVGRSESDATAIVFVDGQEQTTVTFKSDWNDHKIDLELEEGDHTIRVEHQMPTGEDQREDRKELRIERFDLNGPWEGEPLPPPNERRFFSAIEDMDRSENFDRSQAARRVFGGLLSRAFRRPATDSEVDAIVSVVNNATEQGFSFEQSCQFGIQATLVSPNFLFRIEKPNGETARLVDSSARSGEAEAVGNPLTDAQIATRLSYFLWSTMPDAELTAAALEGKLQTEEELRLQATRMLESEKGSEFVDGFFEQWLGLRNLDTIDASQEIFPHWNDRLTAAMRTETKMVCRELLLNDGTVRDLLDCNFTFVNPRMAEHYGMTFDGQDPAELYRNGPGNPRRRGRHERSGIYERENDWIRVELPDTRGGLLTQASVLTLTSNPTRTSPVKRGKWVLENFLGEPPPPAPPGVPSLEEGADHSNLSLREQLQIHREDPSCASCHRVMDPIGLGLENFDAIGRYRTKDKEYEINAAGELSDGRKFNGPQELIQQLTGDSDKIARHFVSQLYVYALGRGLKREDSCTIDEIAAQTEKDGYRLRDLVTAVILSRPFRSTGFDDTLLPTVAQAP
jgi:hypothetical protein